MKTTALRLYGANDIRLEQFELPQIGEKEILIEVVSDAICASTYKAVCQGVDHKRVPPDIGENPVILGHELCGKILQIGGAVTGWEIGQKVVLQPALKQKSGYDPGYSFPYIGGNTQYAVVPEIVLNCGCLLPYEGEGYYAGSLAESLGCCIRGFKGLYHTDYTNYLRTDGPKKGGRMAILGGAGPMGIGCVELAKSMGISQIVVTDIDQGRLDAAKSACPYAYYVNTSQMEDPVSFLLEISGGGFDDVLVMVPVSGLLSMAEQLCREDGCINFFAGPADHGLQGSLNLYRIHYEGIHLVGTAGSIPADMTDILTMTAQKSINPAVMVSHILGLPAIAETLMDMGKPNGAKKICYNHLDIPIIAISELKQRGETDSLCAALAEIVDRNGGLWCAEAEEYLLSHAPRLT